jgi:dCTP deaminase
MLLSDRSIRKAISTGQIEIDPEPAGMAIQPSSVDLRLGHYIRRFRQPLPGDFLQDSDIPNNILDPFDHITYAQITILEKINESGVVIHPGEFVLASTVESIFLDNKHSARLEGKSSLGRLGIEIHSTAGFIDPGFEGHPTLEISNNLQFGVRLFAGMYIAQICFMVLDQPATFDYGECGGKYMNQSEKPEPSKYYLNERLGNES